VRKDEIKLGKHYFAKLEDHESQEIRPVEVVKIHWYSDSPSWVVRDLESGKEYIVYFAVRIKRTREEFKR